MAFIIYGLCALTAFVCACLLLQAYAKSRYRLLLWGGLCFVGFTANNVLLVADKFFVPAVDLSAWRLAWGLLGISVLLYGLIWDTE